MENTIVTPHSLCWTDECFNDIATSALSDIAAAMAGRRPTYVRCWTIRAFRRGSMTCMNEFDARISAAYGVDDQTAFQLT